MQMQEPVNGQLMTHGTDAQLHVRFEYQAVHMKFESEAAGRPIYKDVPFVTIRLPGDKHSAVVEKVTEAHKQRFPQQWARFVNSQEQVVDGTPLSQWPAMSVSQVAELTALNVQSVEQLAKLSDAGIQKLGIGGRDLVRRAQAYLQQAKDSAHAEHLSAELGRRDDEIALLKEQMRELAARLDGDETKPKRGRPPKVQEAA